MRVLLENNVNYRFGWLLPDHQVVHAQYLGWELLKNGDLIGAAEGEGFDALITADKSMRYQQAIRSRKITIIVLNSLYIKWAFIEPLAPLVNEALRALRPVSFLVVSVESGVNDMVDDG